MGRRLEVEELEKETGVAKQSSCRSDVYGLQFTAGNPGTDYELGPNLTHARIILSFLISLCQ